MEYVQRLPQNFKEKCLFMAIISLLSVNLIAPLITGMTIGFSWSEYLTLLPRLPLIWLVVIILVIITERPATFMARQFLQDTANFRVTMLVTAMCNVLLMSVILTIVGAWIGTGQVSLEAIIHFPLTWPRNYTLALIVEAGIAQPLARCVMAWLHRLLMTNSHQLN